MKRNNNQEVSEGTKKQKLDYEKKSGGTPELSSVGHSDMPATRVENSELQDYGVNTILLLAVRQQWGLLTSLINNNKVTSDMLAARYENPESQDYGANTILVLAAHQQWELLTSLINNNKVTSDMLAARYENPEYLIYGVNTIMVLVAHQQWELLTSLIDDNKITSDMLAARYGNPEFRAYGANTILVLAFRQQWGLLTSLINNNKITSDMLAARYENPEFRAYGVNTILFLAADQKWDLVGRLINDKKITSDILASRYENPECRNYGANIMLLLAADKQWDLLSSLIDNNQITSDILAANSIFFMNNVGQLVLTGLEQTIKTPLEILSNLDILQSMLCLLATNVSEYQGILLRYLNWIASKLCEVRLIKLHLYNGFFEESSGLIQLFAIIQVLQYAHNIIPENTTMDYPLRNLLATYSVKLAAAEVIHRTVEMRSVSFAICYSPIEKIISEYLGGLEYGQQIFRFLQEPTIKSIHAIQDSSARCAIENLIGKIIGRTTINLTAEYPMISISINNVCQTLCKRFQEKKEDYKEFLRHAFSKFNIEQVHALLRSAKPLEESLSELITESVRNGSQLTIAQVYHQLPACMHGDSKQQSSSSSSYHRGDEKQGENNAAEPQLMRLCYKKGGR